MAGHFYAPPPTFIGGRQPYAPKLGQVQSGPAPSTPPLPVNRANFRIIEARYREDPWTIISLSRIAPLLTTPAVPDNPPARSFANQRVIFGQWEPIHRPLPFSIKVAPFVPAAATPDNPPRRSDANRNVILGQWIPPYQPLPRRATLAPLLPAAPVADSPPKLAYQIRNVILRQWAPSPVQYQPRATQAVPDTAPDQFTFTDQSGVAVSSTITSAAITVAGISAAATITVSGGTYDINGSGTFVSTAGTVNNGDTVRARHTSSASYLAAVDTIVTIGGVSDTFRSITEGDPAQAAYIKRPFSLNWWSH
jgi:hypothetical protein